MTSTTQPKPWQSEPLKLSRATLVPTLTRPLRGHPLPGGEGRDARLPYLAGDEPLRGEDGGGR